LDAVFDVWVVVDAGCDGVFDVWVVIDAGCGAACTAPATKCR
jgi:hypothetical protein